MEKSIVVLPFVNMSSSQDMEFFSDGISEEIINALAKIRNLKVISRTSSFFYKGKNLPANQIAQKLKVATILEGSVRLSAKTARITAQLIHASEDYHFWSETWDRKLDNIFEVQDEISLLIADKLREFYGHFDIQEHLVEKKTDSFQAYEYSLKAKYHFNKWNPEDVRTSINLFEKAKQLDPNLIDAYVGLADAYGFLAATEIMNPAETWKIVRDYTNKAYEIDPNNAAVHYQLANLSFFQETNFQEAAKHANRSVELNPSYPEAQQFMTFLYILSENMEKADQHLQIALKIDPLSQETLFYNAYYHYRTGKYKEAQKLYDQCLEANPKNIPAYVVKSYCLLKLGACEEALQSIENMPKELDIPDEKLGIICLAHILKKDEKQSKIYFEKLQTEANKPFSFVAQSYLFLALACMEKTDEAFAWTQKMINSKSPIIQLSFTDPLANSLKANPRYPEFKNRMYGSISFHNGSQNKVPLLDNDSAQNNLNQLLLFMDDEKPYLIPNISLRSLAGQVEIHPNKLSWLLNEHVGKNFNDFINHYRIHYFKNLVLNPENAKISLIGLAYESGFNSKTVFNTSFKKETGITPKEFVKQHG